MREHRNTRQRQLVLNAVRARHDHPSADQIYQDVRAVDGKISRGTVYRNLHVLVRQSALHHVETSEADRFECRADAHYHLICQRCGAVRDVPMPYDGALDAIAAGDTGFTVERHYTVFKGICPDCREKTL